MDRQLLPPRPNPIRLVARWVIGGLVITGVLVMHVLAAPDDGNGHTMTLGIEMSAPMGAMSASADAGIDQPTVVELHRQQAAPTHNDMSTMTCCILFLVTGFSLLLLALARTARRRTDPSRQSGRSSGFGPWLRAPPGSLPPRISLCVMRV